MSSPAAASRVAQMRTIVALGIGERGGDGVAAPEAGPVLGLGRLAGLASHRAAMARGGVLGKRGGDDNLTRWQGGEIMATIAAPGDHAWRSDRIFYTAMGAGDRARHLLGLRAELLSRRAG